MDLTNEQWAAKIDSVEAKINSSGKADGISSTQHQLDAKTLAGYIDHTILKLDATEAQVDSICEEAKQYNFAAVCVRENFVARAVSNLRQSGIPVACVIGFHEGTQSLDSKVSESARAVAAGAFELDVVLNRDLLGQKQYRQIYEELRAIREVATKPTVELKLILETSRLNQSQVVAASVLAGYAGWEYIKTSTGFEGRGASVEDVILMSETSKVIAEIMESEGITNLARMKVKASGGIRSFDDASKMIQAGASRIGASAGVNILQELAKR